MFRRWFNRLWMWWRIWSTKASLPTLTTVDRKDGELAFRAFCLLWIQGWGEQHEVEKEQDVHVLTPDGNKYFGVDGYPIFEKKMVKVIEAVPQPDRIAAMRELGHGRLPRSILIMAYERGSLQALVSDALKGSEDKLPSTLADKPWIEVVDVIAANMIQVCHMAFPDLSGTYDYTQRWKEKL
jgi:hypothetical protein